MSYSVKYTDSNKTPIQIDDNEVKTDVVDISIIGRLSEFGDFLNENLLHILENFASVEDSANPGNPDLTKTTNALLSHPTEGQLWFNQSQNKLFVYDSIEWKALRNGNDVAANSGKILNGQYIPLPKNDLGIEYAYSECIFSVAQSSITEEFDYSRCSVDYSTGLVTSQYRRISDGQMVDAVANYLIIGIKNNLDGVQNANNNNVGTVIIPGPLAPSPTPTTTPSPTPSPTSTSGASPTPSNTPLPVNLCSGLISYYDAEAFGPFSKLVDATGANDMNLDGGTPSLVAGKINTNAVYFAGGTGTSYTVENDSGFLNGLGGYTFGGWYKFPSVTPNRRNRIFSPPGMLVYYTPGEYTGQVSNTEGQISVTRYINSSTSYGYTIPAAASFKLDDDNWHLIIVKVDTDSDSLYVYIDNVLVAGPVNTGFSGIYRFITNSFGELVYNARFTADGMFYYNRTLNASELTSLYNSGSGLAYTGLCPAVTQSPTPTPTPTPSPTSTPAPSVTPSITPSATPNPAYIVTGGYYVSSSGLNSNRGYNVMAGPPFDIGSIDHDDFGPYTITLLSQGHYTYTGSPYSLIHLYMAGAPVNAFTSIILYDWNSGTTTTLYPGDASTSPGAWAWYVPFGTDFFQIGTPSTVYIVP